MENGSGLALKHWSMFVSLERLVAIDGSELIPHLWKKQTLRSRPRPHAPSSEVELETGEFDIPTPRLFPVQLLAQIHGV